MNTQIYKDEDDLAAHAADLIVEAAREAVAVRGRFTIALAGGKTPKKTYAALAQPERAAQIDWAKFYVFFGDERFCLPDDENSNYGMARLSLLSHVPIPAENVFPMPTGSNADEDASAAQYAQTLADFFGLPAHGLPPCFDLILLGLGDDGHTASLFPGAPATTVTDAWVASTPPGVLPPPVDRLTFTFPVLNAARHVMFLVAGEKKAAIVAEVHVGRGGREVHPAEGVQPADGMLTWLLDQTSAAKL